MREIEPGIECPIFLKREWTIKQLTRDINAAGKVSDKAERAEQLKNQVELLLSCEKYDEKKEDCKKCKTISMLRKQTAELLIKAEELGEE